MSAVNFKRVRVVVAIAIESFFLVGCFGRYMWAPPKNTDYWSKAGYKEFQIQAVMESCGNTLPRHDICMLARGFRYVDPTNNCKGPNRLELLKNDLECQSLESNFKLPPHEQDCVENGEAARSDTCGGIPILHGKYFIRVVDAAGLQIPKSGNWQADTIGGLYSGRNRSCKDFPNAQILFINENGRRLAGENPYQCDRSKTGLTDVKTEQPL